MKKIVLVSGIVVLVVGLAAAGYVAFLLRSLDTPEFERKLLGHAKTVIGTEVQVREMEISVLSGVTLEGVTIANPAPYRGAFLTADSFLLRYRLLPLLAGRLEVERFALERPLVELLMDARGGFNYEKLGGTPAPTRRNEEPASGRALPITLELRQLAVRGAGVVMRDHTRAVMMKVDDAELDAAFEVTAAGARGAGQARIAVLNAAETLFVRGISAPIEISKQALTLGPIRGELAGGAVTGRARVDLAGGFQYTADLEVRGAAADTLLQEARVTRAVAGTLAARASFEGSGGLPTVKGKGRAEVTDCQVSSVRVLSLLAVVLTLPELANPDLDQCLVEFRMAGSRLHTPVLRLAGKQIQITGSGTLNLETSALDYDLTLALAQPLLNKITARQLRAAFQERGDGFSTVEFAVGGTTLAPRTDLATRVGKAAAGEAVRKGLGRLLR